MKKLKQLNNEGFTHWIVLVVVVVIIVGVGAYVLKSAHHAPPKSTNASSSVGIDLPKLPVLKVNKAAGMAGANAAISLTQPLTRYPNWTGYGLTGQPGAFTMAEATVNVPTISCPSTTQSSQFSLWVGLDGFSNDSTVEQDGIRANCDEQPNNCTQGQPNCTDSIQPDYYTWLEMYPGPVLRSSVPIQPGDHVHIEVWYDTAKNDYALLLHNESMNGPSASSTQYYPCQAGIVCQRSSAEWISENHVSDENLLISTFGHASFTNAEASTSADLTAYPFTDWKNYPMEATVSNQTLETVTDPLNETTSSFSLTQLQNS
jgi:hypothetical protein